MSELRCVSVSVSVSCIFVVAHHDINVCVSGGESVCAAASERER